jgi:hypothetical protein
LVVVFGKSAPKTDSFLPVLPLKTPASRRGKHPATVQRNRPVSEYLEAGVFSGKTGRNESVFGADLPKTTTNEFATWARAGLEQSQV